MDKTVTPMDKTVFYLGALLAGFISCTYVYASAVTADTVNRNGYTPAKEFVVCKSCPAAKKLTITPKPVSRNNHMPLSIKFSADNAGSDTYGELPSNNTNHLPMKKDKTNANNGEDIQIVALNAPDALMTFDEFAEKSLNKNNPQQQIIPVDEGELVIATKAEESLLPITAPTTTSPKCNDAIVSFNFDSAYLTKEAKEAISNFTNCVKGKGGAGKDIIRVIGQANNIGGDGYNQKIAAKRAESVATYMSDNGVTPHKVDTFINTLGKKGKIVEIKLTQEGV